jgi:subtilisin
MAPQTLTTIIAVLPVPEPHRGEISLLSTNDNSVLVKRVSSYFNPSPFDPDHLFIATVKDAFNNLPLDVDAPRSTLPNLPAYGANEPRHFPRLGLIVGDIDTAGLKKLRRDPDVVDVVQAVAPKMVFNIDLLEDVGAQRSWSIDFLKVPELWNRGITGKGLAIGHLDSGIDGGHPALRRGLKQFATIDRTGTADESGAAQDNHGHGTHTAGILCAQPIDGTTVGIAPDAELFSGQITGDGSLMRMLGGLEWLLGKNVRLLSLSAGIEPFNPVFQAVIDRLRATNILPIVSIGNDFAGTSFSPGNYQNALGIGSISQQSMVADSSCSQAFAGPPPYAKPDLVAPGAAILSTRRFGGYEMRSGTSQAAPCVVGIAALLMQAFPRATIPEIETAIKGSCRKLEGIPVERQGRGVIDPITALNILGG